MEMENENEISNLDKQHINRLFTQEAQINAMFVLFVKAISPEMRKWKHYAGNSVWVRNSSIEKFINLRLLRLQALLEVFIKKNQKEAWYSAIAKNDKIVEQYIREMAISEVARNGMFSRNLDALKALQNRIDNGLNLSQRVWKITEQTKYNIELFLESGVATGRNASEIARDLNQMLINPDKRFRRVRDKEGKLILSQPMKDYHPGQGVYRSSRMNALRVAATETNMGYRVSDSERWRQLDFVLGFEVKRSPNAKPCKVCDALKGKYPKGFVFPGWHPFCICFAVPVVMNHSNFADYLLKGTMPKSKFVKNIPSSAQSFIDNNPVYLEKSYFGKMNEAFFK